MQDLSINTKRKRQYKEDAKIENDVINIISSDDEKDNFLAKKTPKGKQSKNNENLVYIIAYTNYTILVYYSLLRTVNILILITNSICLCILIYISLLKKTSHLGSSVQEALSQIPFKKKGLSSKR